MAAKQTATRTTAYETALPSTMTRRNRRRTARGVSAGSLLQSDSTLSTVARVSAVIPASTRKIHGSPDAGGGGGALG